MSKSKDEKKKGLYEPLVSSDSDTDSVSSTEDISPPSKGVLEKVFGALPKVNFFGRSGPKNDGRGEYQPGAPGPVGEEKPSKGPK